MKKVKFRFKDANHGLRIDGKRIQFIDGEAKVDENTAESIKKLEDPNYIIEDVEPVNEDKPEKNAVKKTRKSKKAVKKSGKTKAKKEMKD